MVHMQKNVSAYTGIGFEQFGRRAALGVKHRTEDRACKKGNRVPAEHVKMLEHAIGHAVLQILVQFC